MKIAEDIKSAVSKYEPDINMWINYRYRRGI